MKKLLIFCVALTTLSACRKDKGTEQLACTSPVTANFEIQGEDCTAPCQLQFKSLSEGADLFDWDFGDGSSGTKGANAIHTFQRPGVYLVSLKAGAVGTSCEDVQTRFVEIGSQTFEWGHVGPTQFIASGLVQTPDNGYLVTGSNPDGESVLYRLNDKGLIEWVSTLEVGEESNIHWITPYASGNYLVGSAFNFGTVPQTNPVIAEINDQGGVLWSRRYVTFEGVLSAQVAVAEQGGFWIAGNSKTHLYIGRANILGALEWSKTYERDTLTSNFCQALIELEDGDLAVLERASTPTVTRLTRLSPEGDVRWERIFSEHQHNHLHSIHHSKHAGFTLSGYMRPTVGSFNAWMVRTDQQGNTIWERTYGGVKADYALDMTAVGADGFLLVGQTKSWTHTQGHAYLIRTDANGEVLWERYRGGSDLDAAEYVIQTSDGGFAVAGTTFSPELVSVGGIHLYILKTDADGNVNQ